jgi:hypothetical protein
LGITRANGMRVPRQLFQVTHVSSTCLRLQDLLYNAIIPNKQQQQQQAVAVARRIRKNEIQSIYKSVEPLELLKDDVLKIGGTNFFRVVQVNAAAPKRIEMDAQQPPAQEQQQPPSRTRRRVMMDQSNTTSTTTAASSSDRPRKKLRDKKTSSSQPAADHQSSETDQNNTLMITTKKNVNVVQNATIKKKPPKANTTKSDYRVADSSGRMIVVLPKGMEPFRPSRRWGDFDDWSSAPELWPKANAEDQRHQEANAKRSDNPDSDHDEEEAITTGPTDMHTSLANVYWKALNSAQPHIGAQFLHMLLESDELPPARLCGDLMHLLTFGPQNQGHAFYDGNRLQLALACIRRLVEKHPNVMYERLAEAAGSEYWKTVLDQLFTLPYGEDDTIVDDLNLHSFSVKVLELLWEGLHKMENSTQLPLIRDLHSFSGKAACKVAANAMAHVWVRHGNHILPGGSSGDGNNDIAFLLDVTYRLTQQLARIVTSWLQEFVPNKRDRLDILWNPMDAQLRDSSVPKKEQKDLKLHWVCSLDRTPSWDDLGPQLAKRVGIEKEYSRWTEDALEVGRLLAEVASEEQSAN